VKIDVKGEYTGIRKEAVVIYLRVSVLKMGRYMLVYHTGTFSVPEFHTGTDQYIAIVTILFSFIF
jgi:hypothetical protein